MHRNIALFAVAWLASACAFTDLTIDLPAEGFKPTTTEFQGRQVLVDIPFADGREIRDRCGMKKNGFNMDTADIFCGSDPSEWIAKLLADQLRDHWFRSFG